MDDKNYKRSDMIWAIKRTYSILKSGFPSNIFVEKIISAIEDPDVDETEKLLEELEAE